VTNDDREILLRAARALAEERERAEEEVRAAHRQLISSMLGRPGAPPPEPAAEEEEGDGD
jgi:undecaprenyl pyrophosphate synthase